MPPVERSRSVEVVARDSDCRELLGLRDRQRADAEGVEQLKHRRVRADAECQRQNRDGREARVQTQQADAIAQILNQTPRGTPMVFIR